jgi:hypothetical protein
MIRDRAIELEAIMKPGEQTTVSGLPLMKFHTGAERRLPSNTDHLQSWNYRSMPAIVIGSAKPVIAFDPAR